MTGITVTVGALRSVTQAIAAPVGEDFPQFVTETPNDPFSGGSFLTGPWRWPLSVWVNPMLAQTQDLDYILKMFAVVLGATLGGIMGIAGSRGMPGVGVLGVIAGAALGAWFSGIEPILIIIVAVVCLAIMTRIPRPFEARS